jgi:hypothetical protein
MFRIPRLILKSANTPLRLILHSIVQIVIEKKYQMKKPLIFTKTNKNIFLTIFFSFGLFSCKQESKINHADFLIGDKWCYNYAQFCVIFTNDSVSVSNYTGGEFNSHKRTPFHITKIDYENNIIYTQRIESILGNLYSFKIINKDTVEFKVQGALKSEKLYRVKF